MLHIASRSIIIRRLVAGLGMCLGLTKQTDAAGEPAPAPAPFVQDDARLFDAAIVESMSRALAETERACGVSIYVAISSFLKTTGARGHEQAMVERRLDDKPGMILTYNRGDGRTAVLPSPKFWRRYPADEIAGLLAAADRVLTRPGAAPEERIQETVKLIVERLPHLDASRRSSRDPFTGVERRLAIAVAATLALALLAGWFGARVRRRKAAELGGPFVFPEATVNSRLGGQFGGGAIGESSARRLD